MSAAQEALDDLAAYVRDSAEKRRYGKTRAEASLRAAQTEVAALESVVVQLREALLEAQRLLASGHQDSRREAQDVIAAAVSEETPK